MSDHETNKSVNTVAPLGHNASDGNDAICFTAGSGGAYFGAGVIHAYLASRRRAPKVAAGISAGAITAAAMQKCYAELEEVTASCQDGDYGSDARQRWAWFRKYVRAMTDNPLSALWDAIPDMSDFFADMPPICDTSLPRGEAGARKQRYILIKLGRWLADLPISVRTIAETIVHYVRYKEKYGHLSGGRVLVREVYLFVRVCIAMLFPSRKNVFPEYLFDERDETQPAQHRPEHSGLWRYARSRPLFGWKIFGVALATVLGFVSLLIACLAMTAVGAVGTRLISQSYFPLLMLSFAIAAFLIWVVFAFLAIQPFPPQSSSRQRLRTMAGLVPAELLLGLTVGSSIRYVDLREKWDPTLGPLAQHACAVLARIGWWALIVFTALVVCGLATYVWWHWFGRTRKPNKQVIRENKSAPGSLLQLLMQQIGVSKELVTDFYLLVKMKQLFDPEALHSDKMVEVKDQPMAVVLVAAPLQTILRRRTPEQKPYPIPAQQVWASCGTPLITALRAAIGLPGLMRPVVSENTKLWGVEGSVPQLDLVDGSVIRQNPIPALFSFLQTDAASARENAIVWSLETDDKEDSRLHIVYTVPLHARSLQPGVPEIPSDIVDVALLSMRLARRRDTKLEMEQTAFISNLERLARPAAADMEPIPDPSDIRYKVFPDAIAPVDDISLGDPLQPESKKCFEVMAAGCRQTLSTLYARDLPARGTSTCRALLAKIWKVNVHEVPECPGISEICTKCTHEFARPEAPDRTPIDVDHKQFDHLKGDKPRIVFAASGGVFRGPFQVGALAALLQTNINVDLIVGASVGTLIGSVLGAGQALGAAKASPPTAKLVPVYKLVDLFIHADSSIALTQTLKNALREIGLRARAIKLSPRDIQRMIQRGSRFDPGFAAAGAPPALLDAISTLLVLPFDATKGLAMRFTSGEIAKAVSTLLKKVREQTLDRLGILNYLMGVSLLEPRARQLLAPTDGKIKLDSPQPFLRDGKVALFATTTNLLTWESKVLGAPSEFKGSYDFVEAALSSSAFPAVFQPRREADVYPGLGSATVRFADGGMFDNLPFIPALRILGTIQSSYAVEESWATPEKALVFLANRHRNPDLIIAASLNVNPENDPERYGPFDSILAVSNRAKILDSNVKIRDFELASTRIHRQIDRFLGRYASDGHGTQPSSETCSGEDVRFINGIVDAAVLPVFPSSKKHLNGTFSFCRTLGLDEERILRSVADGCYQTLSALAKAQATPFPQGTAFDSEQLVAKSMSKLVECKKIPKLFRMPERQQQIDRGMCPFFSMVEGAFTCPFTEATQSSQYSAAGRVHCACTTDEIHRAGGR